MNPFHAPVGWCGQEPPAAAAAAALMSWPGLLLFTVFGAPALLFGSGSFSGLGLLSIALVSGARRAASAGERDLSPGGGALLLLGSALTELLALSMDEAIWTRALRAPQPLLFLGYLGVAVLVYLLGSAWTRRRDPAPASRPGHLAPLALLFCCAALAASATHVAVPLPLCVFALLSVPLVARRCGGDLQRERWLATAPQGAAELQRGIYITIRVIASAAVVLLLCVGAAVVRGAARPPARVLWLPTLLSGVAGLWALAASFGLALRARWLLAAPRALWVGEALGALHARLPGQDQTVRIQPALDLGDRAAAQLTLLGLAALPPPSASSYREPALPLAVPLLYRGDPSCVAAAFLGAARDHLWTGFLSAAAFALLLLVALR